ncbi:mannose-binding protein C [Biomphalaria glabrata]|nr:mannose-binding protein C [Biomphalaria glabrata]
MLCYSNFDDHLDQKMYVDRPSQRTGTQLNVFDWSAGEPNNYERQEDCLELIADRAGRLNDVPCNNPSGAFSALCEKELF